jgi:hypothetical protein
MLEPILIIISSIILTYLITNMIIGKPSDKNFVILMFSTFFMFILVLTFLAYQL